MAVRPNYMGMDKRTRAYREEKAAYDKRKKAYNKRKRAIYGHGNARPGHGLLGRYVSRHDIASQSQISKSPGFFRGFLLFAR